MWVASPEKSQVCILHLLSFRIENAVLLLLFNRKTANGSSTTKHFIRGLK